MSGTRANSFLDLDRSAPYCSPVNDLTEIAFDESPLWKSLLHAAERVESRFEVALSASGLSLSKLGVLRILVEAGEPLPLSRLAGKLACVKSNVTQLIDRLEADGLVARTSDPGDRRSVLASVTDEGRRRFESGRRAIEAVDGELFGPMCQVERGKLIRLLDAVGTKGCNGES